jgi:hypothetical protein
MVNVLMIRSLAYYLSRFRETLLLFSNRCYTIFVTNKSEERRGWFVLVYKLPAEPPRPILLQRVLFSYVDAL